VVHGSTADYTGHMHEDKQSVAAALLWTLAAVLLAAIVTLSVIPANQAGSIAAATHVPAAAAGASINSGVQDAAWHCLFYGPFTLTLLLAAAWRPGLPRPSSHRPALLLILAVGTLGLLLEIVQAAWFGRSSELVDVVGNVAGLALGATAWRGIEWLYTAPAGFSLAGRGKD
jgi:VanZ family protein